MFGSPETTPGGRALKFYASIRLDVRKIETLKQGMEVIGCRTRVKVVKNKVAPPFKQAEFDIMYGKGISREGSILDTAVTLGIVNKSGAWYSCGDERLGQGRENAKDFLKEHLEMAKEIEQQIRQKLNGGEIKTSPITISSAIGDAATESEEIGLINLINKPEET